MKQPGFKKYAAIIALAGLCAFHILFNYIWVYNDFSFNSFPHYGYLWAFETYSLLKAGEIIIYPAYFLISAIIFYLCGGPSLFLLNSIPTGFLIILIIAIYLLCKELWNRKVGVLAAVITSFFPFIFGASRWFDFHTALMAMTVLCYYLLVRLYKNFTFLNCVFLFLVMVTGGLMDKCSNTETIAFLVTVSGGWLYFSYLWLGRLSKGRSNKGLYFQFGAILLTGILLFLYLASVTSLFNLEDAIIRTVTPVQDQIVTLLDRIAQYFAYLVCLPAAYIGTLFTVIFIACSSIIIKGKIKYRGFLFLWFGNVMVFFSLFIKKHIVYPELMLPAIGIIMALGLLSVRQSARKAIIILVVLFSVIQCLCLSFCKVKYQMNRIFYWPDMAHIKYMEHYCLFTAPPNKNFKEDINNLVFYIKRDLSKEGIMDIDRPLRLFGVSTWYELTCKTTTMLYIALEKSGIDTRIKRAYIWAPPLPTPKQLLVQILPSDIVLIREKGEYYSYENLARGRIYEQIFLENFLIFKEYIIGTDAIKLAINKELLSEIREKRNTREQ